MSATYPAIGAQSTPGRNKAARTQPVCNVEWVSCSASSSNANPMAEFPLFDSVVAQIVRRNDFSACRVVAGGASSGSSG
jgi:hypothetical protein